MEEIKSIWTILCVIFSCGTAYATIKVSLRSVIANVEKLEKEVDNMQDEVVTLKTEREVAKVRYETLDRKFDDMKADLRSLIESFNKLEKRGDLRWRESASN